MATTQTENRGMFQAPVDLFPEATMRIIYQVVLSPRLQMRSRIFFTEDCLNERCLFWDKHGFCLPNLTATRSPSPRILDLKSAVSVLLSAKVQKSGSSNVKWSKWLTMQKTPMGPNDPKTHQTIQQLNKSKNNMFGYLKKQSLPPLWSQRIPLWYVYLHLVDLYGKWWNM